MDSNEQEISIFPASENSLLITWPEKICPIQHQQIINLAEQLQLDFASYIFETVISYNSLLVYYYFDRISTASLTEHLQALWQAVANASQHAQKTPTNSKAPIEIPVYYGNEVALDLIDVANASGLDCNSVIELHSQRIYRAYALGFTPGFCYLGSLAKALVLPRKQTPRLTVAKGSVAIAEQQTAIYPCNSPGGWHIIGKTPLAMYQAKNNEFMPKISVGDIVKFVPIDQARFIEQGGKL